jgi:peptide deformylase
MLLKIAQLGQPVLRRRAAEIPPEQIRTEELQRLIDSMLDTLQEAHGAGLAGPQVFAGRRLFLAAVLPPRAEDSPPEVEVFINPRIVALSHERRLAWEGCLSFSELLVLVPRHRHVRVEYLNRHGEPRTLDLEDFAARVVQHEHDHLEGILTLDRAPSPRYIVKASEIDAVLADGEQEPDAGGPESEAEGEAEPPP